MSDDCPLPIYIDDNFTLNTFKYSKRELKEDTYTVHNHTYIIIKDALNPNDIFFQTRASDVLYYIKKFMGFTNKDMRRYEIKRYDGASITTLDLNRLRKGKIIQHRGKFKNCKSCEK